MCGLELSPQMRLQLWTRPTTVQSTDTAFALLELWKRRTSNVVSRAALEAHEAKLDSPMYTDTFENI